MKCVWWRNLLERIMNRVGRSDISGSILGLWGRSTTSKPWRSGELCRYHRRCDCVFMFDPADQKPRTRHPPTKKAPQTVGSGKGRTKGAISPVFHPFGFVCLVISRRRLTRFVLRATAVKLQNKSFGRVTKQAPLRAEKTCQ